MLKKLSKDVTERDRRKGQIHKAFEPSFDAKACYNEKFIIQKFNYIHHNPVSCKWNLTDDFTEYMHSSAKFYELNKEGVYRVTHYKDNWR